MFEEIFVSVLAFMTTLVASFLQSKIFFVIKIFLAIYSAVLIVDVILLIYLGDVKKQMRALRTGTSNVSASKKKAQKEWSEIEKRLDSENEQFYRAAILEADQFVYKNLEVQGYSGSNFAERIAQIPPHSFTSLQIIRDAHALSTKIIQDDKLRITKEQAQNTLNVYKQFLEEIDVL